jgi:hypothetical protein
MLQKFNQTSSVLIAASSAGISNAKGEGPLMPIDLGYAETFVVLSESGITDIYPSNVTGDVGTSPITGAAPLLSCGEVSGNVYSVYAAGPMTCTTTDASFLTAAVGDMGFAYTNAAGRISPDVTELAAGAIGELTLEPGLYK